MYICIYVYNNVISIKFIELNNQFLLHISNTDYKKKHEKVPIF